MKDANALFLKGIGNVHSALRFSAVTAEVIRSYRIGQERGRALGLLPAGLGALFSDGWVRTKLGRVLMRPHHAVSES